MDAVREKTGRTITDRHAAAVVAQLIGDRTDIRNPTAYVRSAIARDPDPARFLPTPAPPRFRAIPGGPA